MPLDTHIDHGGFDAVATDWQRLHEASLLATPFMSPGWARAWWAEWDPGAEPFTVVVRDGGEVVGLAPLVRRRKGPLRVLEPVGMDPGDYWDVLSAPGREQDVATAVAGALRAGRGG